MERTEFDISLSGEEEDLPPGVVPGSLTGYDPDEAAPFDPNGAGAQLDADLDAAVGGDDAAEDPESGTQDPESASEDMDVRSPDEPPTPVAQTAPAPRRGRPPKRKSTSGTIDRLYYIFEMTQAEIDGQIIEVPLRRTFVGPDGKAAEGIVARNRDLALSRAARHYGPGWKGVLVATPQGMWDPTEVENVPSQGFSPRIGGGA